MAQNIIPFTLYGGEVTGRLVENDETGYRAYFVTDQKNGIKNARPTGVTTICGIKDKSRPLLSWAAGLARNHLEAMVLAGKTISVSDIYEACGLYEVRKQEAANIGKDIHGWCEKYINWRLDIDGFAKPEIPKAKNVQLGVVAFLEWEEKHKVEFVGSEKIVYSRNHGFIGTMDIKGKVDGKRAVIDLKTGNSLQNSVRAQTAAYAKADMEETPSDPWEYDTRWAIRLSKETKEEYDARMLQKGLKDWPDYQVFEAMEFAEDMQTDFNAFLGHKIVYDWDRSTDFYKLKQQQKSIAK